MSATVQHLTLTVEAAFGDAPLTATASNTWTDITAYVRGVGWRRGRSHSLDSVQPGVCTITLDNSGRRFDPLYSAGAYYGDLKPNVKVRVSLVYSGTTYRMFTGYVNGWPQEYASGNKDAECTITCVDAFKLLGMHDMDESMFTSWVASLNPTHWWRLNESDNATTVTDHGTVALPAMVAKTPDFSSDSLDVGSSSTATSFRGLTGMAPECLVIPDSLEGWTSLSLLFRIPADMPSTWGSIGGYAWSCADLSVWLNAGVTSTTIYVFDWTESKQAYTTTSIPHNRMHHVVVKRNSGTYPSIYVDGALMTTGTAAAGNTFGDDRTWIGGQDDSVDGRQFLGARLQHVATFSTDITGRADELYLAASGETASGGGGGSGATPGYDAVGTRVGEVLDIVGWPSADRDVDTGTTNITTASPRSATAVSYLQTLEATEQGLLFVAGDGDITFIDREALNTAARHTTSQTTFSDDGSNARYFDASLSFEYDDDQLRNEVVVSGDGIETQRATDATSATTYGKRSESITTFIPDHRVARSLAEYRVLVRKDPVTRPSAFTVKPERDHAGIYPVLLDLEIGDRITVERTPQGVGSQVAIQCLLDSMAWRIDRNQDITCTISASPIADVDWFIIGTSLLDGSDVLAY